LVGRQEEHPACKKVMSAGAIVCLELDTNDLRIVQLTPLPPCFIKIQIGLTCLMTAYPGFPMETTVKWMFVS